MEYFRGFHLKRFLFCIILFVVVLVGCLLPWPTRIDTEMTCVEVSADGQELSEGALRLQGWQLNYLFQEDTLMLKPISLPGDPSVTIDPGTIILTEAVCTFGSVEILDNSVFSRFSIAIGKNWEECLLCLDGNTYFACSVEQPTPASEIFHTYRFFVP